MKKALKHFKNLLQSKALLLAFGFGVGVIAGGLVLNYQSAEFQASILKEEANLFEYEMPAIFSEYKNIKEIEITTLSNNTFLVKFFATEGEGDSLHPYSFVLNKEGDTLIGGQEM